MSSHHIVREKQEPALLILSLEGFSPENLGQLLEWSPTVMVSEEAYDHANSLGIKIDLLLSGNAQFDTQEHTLVVKAEDNPLKDGLKFLIAGKYPAVNIITGKFKPADYELFVGEIDLVVFENNKKIFPVRSGFSKWQAKAEIIHLFDPVENLKTKGLIDLSPDALKTERDGFYTISFDNPYIFIAELI